MAQADPSSTSTLVRTPFLPLLLILILGVTAVFSGRWGVRYGGLTILAFNLSAIAAVVFFLFLVQKALWGKSRSADGFAVSPSTIGPWILVFGTAMFVAIAVLMTLPPRTFETAIWDLLGLAAPGFAMGMLMGSSTMRPRERAGIALAIGYVATLGGIMLAATFVRMEVPGRFGSGPLELLDLIPMVAFAGMLAFLEGGMCALGSLLGGSIRHRRATQLATA